MLAFVQLMCWSALAIRDAACLERSRIRKDPDGTTCIVTSRAKTGVNVRVPIPDEVAELLAKVVNGNPKYVFWNGTSLPDSVAKDYQAALRKIFAEAKIVDGRSRRFRDTAAVEWLKSRQLGLFEVSKLLGVCREYVSTSLILRWRYIEQHQNRKWETGVTSFAASLRPQGPFSQPMHGFSLLIPLGHLQGSP